MWRWIMPVLVACVRHAPTPPPSTTCNCGAHAKDIDPKTLCSHWPAHVTSHATFPELDAKSCFVRVHYPGARPDPTPPACAYPYESSRPVLEREVARYEAIANGATNNIPIDLSCELPDEERARAARINATTLRSVLKKESKYPYAAVSAFGYGHPMHEKTPLLTWRPGDACPALNSLHLERLQPNVTRAELAAAAYHGGVAPVVTVSGGAVHSSVYETWILYALLACRLHVPTDAILVDPCADHTHTNLRNTGGLIVALGGRSSYVVTTGMQVGYLEEWTTWDLIGGSIDQRSLRDFGYLVGSFRRASVESDYGFWLTPYRFWADERLANTTCDR
jgi:hypothetical protein